MNGQFTWAFVSALLTGGLAGAILNNAWQYYKEHRTRPNITLAFDVNEPGCLIRTLGTPPEHWVRVKIINEGHSTARGVSVCVTKLTMNGPRTGFRQFEEEVFDLKVANYRGISPFFLASNRGYRLVDLVHIKEGESFFRYDGIPDIGRLKHRGFGENAGTYTADIFVYSENAKSQRRVITWEWNGHFDGFENFRIT